MGAYGSALIAYDQWCDLTAPKPGQEKGWVPPKIVSNIATLEQLEQFKVDLELTRCGGCQNNWASQRIPFPDGVPIRYSHLYNN